MLVRRLLIYVHKNTIKDFIDNQLEGFYSDIIVG